ncbi:MAG TPA: hypothetical protein PLQ35_18155, partial [bacterium]|nr:hypothetical protein [bacterium]
WVSELVLILAVLAAAPWVHQAFNTPTYPGYDPEAPISITAGTPYSGSAVRPIVANAMPVFTNVCVPWLKGYQVGPNWSADRDRWYDSQQNYTDLLDTVEYKVTASGGGVINDWTEDTSGLQNQMMATSSWSPQSSPFLGSFSIKCEVRDTMHQGPPGTTDNASNGTASAGTINWLAPNTEATGGSLYHATDTYVYNGQTYYGHIDQMPASVWNTTQPTLSFKGLYLVEDVTQVYSSGGLWVAASENNATLGDQGGGNNTYLDLLGMYTVAGYQYPATIENHYRVDFYLKASQTSDASIALQYNAYLKNIVIGGYGGEQGRSRRESPQGSLQCPDWPYTLHQ